MKQLAALLIILSICYCTVSAQDMAAVKVQQYKMFNGTLNDALTRFSADYNLRFDYDTAAFKNVDFEWVFSSSSFLYEWKEIVKQYKLKYEVNADGLIRVYLIEQLKNATVVTETQTYAGGSQKKNITVTGKVFDEK
ncbi:MAG: hypothetical protein RLZZ367_1514, partial [Bacteroidota bacterium]